MFLDVAEITVKSGRGGNGAVAFRREANIPNGGPSGGDGGHGGSVVLKVDPRRRTLVDVQYKRSFVAGHGDHGAGTRKTGRSAKNLVVPVPPGTTVYDADTGELLADLVNKGDSLLAARGGGGGRGNLAFTTATRQAPRFAEMGERGEERRLRLELKLIAEAGLVGYPNAGKSTLISRISAAKPKIAPYPFTTLTPNLGVVELGGERSFCVADVPGLIEGAHDGVGLGHQFLRHVERTLALVHIVDVAGTEGREPAEDYRIINRELALHAADLAGRPQLVALNKTDVLQDPALMERAIAAVEADGRRWFAISAVTGEGVAELVGALAALLDEINPVDEDAEPVAPRRFEAPLPAHRLLEVRRMAETVYVVRGTDVEALVQRANLESRDGVEWLHAELDRSGVLFQLEEAGAREGDTVFIGDVELEYRFG
jgi:GTPase